MRQALTSALAVMLLSWLLAACGDRSSNLCRADSFFCSPETEWSSLARKLPAGRLFELDERYSATVGGGSTVLEHELSTRGQGAVDAILTHANAQHEIDTNLLTDVLDQIRYGSKIDICSQGTMLRVRTIVQRDTLQDRTGMQPEDRVKSFEALCSKKR